MPKAILALRRYPLALLMAMVLFVCTLILATSSTGIIRGGDEGSGLGGTGKDGLPGSSGFGGTGGPSPFLGDTGSTEPENENDSTSGQNLDEWPAPWLPRETETARIPEEIAPLIEIQRNPLRDPTRSVEAPGIPGELRIIEQDTSSLPSHLRQQMDLANSAESFTEQPALEIRVQIPEIEAPASTALLQRPLETAEVPPAATGDVTKNEVLEAELETEDETPSPVVDTRALAENAAEQSEQIPEILTESGQEADPRTTTERIQRPELPPFQRLRPAVDRSSVAPASRPQPLRI
jgi:hypothetical protein